MTTETVRTRADIERDLASKRRERLLYVSADGVAKCHAEMDRLLEEWEEAWRQDETSPPETSPAPNA